MRKEELQQTNLGIVKIFLLGYRSDPGRGRCYKRQKGMILIYKGEIGGE